MTKACGQLLRTACITQLVFYKVANYLGVAEFIFRTYEFFKPLDLELLTTFLKDKIEINLHSIEFHNKYADIVFHPNVAKYEEVESYLAREILRIVESTQ